MNMSSLAQWLEEAADDYMRHQDDHTQMIFFDQATCPDAIVDVSVKPFIWDEDGVGSVEFGATTSKGEKLTTIRAVPIPEHKLVSRGEE
jgi:hypothetical protein